MRTRCANTHLVDAWECCCLLCHLLHTLAADKCCHVAAELSGCCEGVEGGCRDLAVAVLHNHQGACLWLKGWTEARCGQQAHDVTVAPSSSSLPAGLGRRLLGKCHAAPETTAQLLPAPTLLCGAMHSCNEGVRGPCMGYREVCVCVCAGQTQGMLLLLAWQVPTWQLQSNVKGWANANNAICRYREASC